MDLTDARTRKKITLNPRTVLSNSCVTNYSFNSTLLTLALHYCRVSGRVATDIVFSNALLVVSVWAIKEWLLSQNVGAFWVLMRVLACGALGLGMREVASGDVPKALEAASSAKVRTLWFFFVFPSLFLLNGVMAYDLDLGGKKWSVLAMGSVAHFLQQGSLLVALSQLSATRYVQYRSPAPPLKHAPVALGVLFTDYPFPLCRFCSVVLVSQFALAWGKTLSSATFVSVISFVSPFLL
jgi:zinc transporter 5/7